MDVWWLFVWAFLCVLSPPGLPAVRAQVLGLLNGELDARRGRGRGRSIIGLVLDGLSLGWRFNWVSCFLCGTSGESGWESEKFG